MRKGSASERKCTVRKWQLLCPHTAVQHLNNNMMLEPGKSSYINAAGGQPTGEISQRQTDKTYSLRAGFTVLYTEQSVDSFSLSVMGLDLI